MTAQKLKIPFRVVSVFVAICLVFSCFSVLSVPADATAAVAGGLVIIGGVVGVGIILQAMGVRPTGGSSSAAWQSLCSSAYAYLQTLSYATVKGIPLATREGRAYVMRDVISALRDWLYSSETIVQNKAEDFGVGTTGSCTVNYYFDGSARSFTVNTHTAPLRVVKVYWTASSGHFYASVYLVSSEVFSCRVFGQYFSGFYTPLASLSGFGDVIPEWITSECLYLGHNVDVTSYFDAYHSKLASMPLGDILSDDFYFDVVKPDVDTDIEIVYVDWAGLEKQLEFPDPDNNDDDDQEDQEDPDKDPEKPPTKPAPGWPIYIPPKPENPDNIPQRELQDPDPDPNLDPDEVQDPTKDPDPTETPDSTEDSDPNKDPTGPTYNPGGNDPFDPGTGTEGGKDDVVIKPPSAKPQNYGVDLTRYFPFCIPFDIYKMLSLLSAEPETPHFTVTLFGKQTTIELSMFDGVAAVARTMETLLFAVTLAAGTKKLIGW